MSDADEHQPAWVALLRSDIDHLRAEVDLKLERLLDRHDALNSLMVRSLTEVREHQHQQGQRLGGVDSRVRDVEESLRLLVLRVEDLSPRVKENEDWREAQQVKWKLAWGLLGFGGLTSISGFFYLVERFGG